MAKIVDLRFTGLEYPLGPVKAYGMARGLAYSRQASLIEVEAEGGVIGIGEAWGPPAMVSAALEVVRPYFLGRDLFDREQIPPYIYAQRYHLGIQNTITSCLGAINIALYDAIGKLLGQPVYKLLGGLNSDSIPAYASDGYFSNNPEGQLEAQLRDFRDQRFPGCKIKIGQSPQKDAERVRLARAVLGPDMLLMVDANGNYTVDLALESMRRIALFDIHFYEEPLAPTDFEGYAALARRAPMPVATGEALYTAHDFKRLIDLRGADVVQPDLTLCGGFDQAKAIATLARLSHLRLSLHVWGSAVGLAAALHFLAALPPWPHTDMIPFPVLLEYDRGDNPLRDRLLSEPIACVDGHLAVPRGPGLGIALNPNEVARWRI